jgi:hypothetical protein
MKTIRFDVLRVTVGVFFVSLLLLASAAQATDVIRDGNESTRAIGITNLDIGGTLHDVDFIFPQEPVLVYGDLPGEFDFNTKESALAATDAVTAALNTEGGVFYVGSQGGTNGPPATFYSVAYASQTFNDGREADALQWRVSFQDGTWLPGVDTTSLWNGDVRTWAVFTHVPSTGNQPPDADAGDPYVGEVGVAVAFDGSGSFDADGTIASWSWDFGDGVDGSGETPSHAYTMNGIFDVTLVVQDSNGLIDAVQTTATIGTGNVPPTADANGPYAAETGAAITFDGSDSSDPEGAIASYAWDFGDSASGSGETTTHTYATEALFSVTLTVTDAAGATDSVNTGATITAPPPSLRRSYATCP